MRFVPERFLWLILLGLSAGCAADGSEHFLDPANPEGGALGGIAERVAPAGSSAVDATLQETPMPSGDAGLPVVTGPVLAESGKLVQLTVSTPDDASELLLTTGDVQSGHWQIPLGEGESPDEVAGTAHLLELELRGSGPWPLSLAARGPSGITKSSSYTIHRSDELVEGVEVRVDWSTRADCDLYVREPDGRVVSWIDPGAREGGVTLAEEFSGCEVPGFPTESVVLDAGTAPTGVYEVLVGLWAACEIEGPIDYVVRVTRDGVEERIPGTFLPEEAETSGVTGARTVTWFNLEPPAAGDQSLQ